MGSKPKKVTKSTPIKDSGPLYNPILSCAGGHYAYVCCKDRTSPKFDTSSDAFAEVISKEGYLDHVRALATASSPTADRWTDVYADLGGEVTWREDLVDA